MGRTGGITVSEGGSTSVDTDELFDLAATMAEVGAEARGWAHQAHVADRIVDADAEAGPFNWSADALQQCGAACEAAAEIAIAVSPALDAAAANYRAAEEGSAEATDLLGSLTAIAAGHVARGILLFGFPIVATVASAAVVISQNPEAQRVVAVLGDRLGLDVVATGLVSNPVVIEIVRSLVSHADDALLGFVGVPTGFAVGLGDHGAGIVGLDTVAGLALVAGKSVGFVETPVTVKRVETQASAPPTSLADIADRIPAAKPGEPQVRVEEYRDENGQPSYAVYVAGTSEATLETGKEPNDMPSNVSAVAGADAAGQRAVEMALKQAGVTADDPVAIFGHSQGGLLAARIAESQEYNVQTLVTFGAPAGQIDVPADVTQLAVEHNDDIIPALGGAPLTGSGASDRLVVSRLAHPGGVPPGAGPLAAHSMDSYRDTAKLIDESGNPRLKGVLSSIQAIGSGPGTAEEYRAERVPR